MSTNEKWSYASESLKKEFGLSVYDLPVLASVKEIFFESVELHELSQEASNAYLYGLYFYGYLSVIEMLANEHQNTELPDLSKPHPVLLAADRWAEKSSDSEKLVEIAAPIIKNTQEIITKLESMRLGN